MLIKRVEVESVEDCRRPEDEREGTKGADTNGTSGATRRRRGHLLHLDSGLSKENGAAICWKNPVA